MRTIRQLLFLRPPYIYSHKNMDNTNVWCSFISAVKLFTVQKSVSQILTQKLFSFYVFTVVDIVIIFLSVSLLDVIMFFFYLYKVCMHLFGLMFHVLCL